MTSRWLDGGQTGPQAYALRGGEDMPSVAGTSGHTAPDPPTNDTGASPGTRVLSYRDLKALATSTTTASSKYV